MIIRDSGFIISQKKFSENLILINILSKNHGLIKGLSRIQKKKKLMLFENVEFNLRVKNLDNLGFLNIETNYNLFDFNEEFFSLLIKASISELCIMFLPTNEKNVNIYYDVSKIIHYLSENSTLSILEKCKEYILFEVKFLENIGYGLSYSKCVVTGSTKNLKYISPKTGCAVTGDEGDPYKSKLFKLPNFFLSKKSLLHSVELDEGFRITTYFLNKAKNGMSINSNKKMIFRKEILNKLIEKQKF